ncbi:acyl-CoA dehydrogenase family protein [Actinomycetospora soli]|uniref:acyl-CoA dehydrogenase family protein n=1 Tax=Actinomycetospora soli TaxID=2893887 RepID=UPI001E340085|nr:acyl-CoA dehydrogenase family protein [Actinomycetospora soli]MCD2190449.1 acyl-CoA dehydrogenase family protein [Actinomycetospora soli]
MTSFVPEIRLPEGAEKLRAEVRAFLDAERARGTLLDRPDSWFAGWDRDFSRRLAEQGWVGMTLPSAYGGGGRSPLERYVVIEELLAAGAPVGAHWVSDRQAGPSILANGTEEQRERYLPAITRGECFFSIGMSEEGAGSDLAAVATRAERDGAGWRLTGTKMWTGGSHVNDAAIVLARSDPEGSRHAGLSQFVIDLHAPEVRAEPIHLLTGEHRFNATHLDGVPGELLGAEGSGWAQVTGELAQERSGPERFLSTFPLLTSLLREPLPDGGSVRVGLLVARLAALRRLSLGVAGALERGESPDVAAALVKDLGTRYEGTVVEEVRALSPVVADPSAPVGSHAEVLALGIGHLPAYTLRGGTNEILRGIITKGLGAPPEEEAPTLTVDPAASVAEQVTAARAIGAAAVAGPSVEDVVARHVLAAAGRPAPDGPLTVVFDDHVTVRDDEGGRVVLDGRPTRVPWGGTTPTVLVTRGAHGPLVAVLEPGRPVVGPGANLAGEPRDTLTLHELPVVATAIDPDVAREAHDRLVLLRAAQIAGAGRRASELAIAHVGAREQFGRPLSSFQAVKQSVAELVEEVALVEAAVAVGTERGGGYGVAVAKAQASASVATVARIAHLLHGAIGFTERSPLRHATTRLWSWRDEDGDERAWAGRLGALAVGTDDLWALVTG